MTYGYRRITEGIRIKYGVIFNNKKVQRIMNKYYLKPKYIEVREIPPSVKAAILLLIGNFYANREPVVTGTITTTLPYSYDYLISLNKNYALEWEQEY